MTRAAKSSRKHNAILANLGYELSAFVLLSFLFCLHFDDQQENGRETNVVHFCNIFVTSLATHCAISLSLVPLFWMKRKRRTPKRYWTHIIILRRSDFGEYHHLLDEVLRDEEKCVSYIRMRPETFQILLDYIGPHVEKRTTNFRKPLSSRERLVITLR